MKQALKYFFIYLGLMLLGAVLFIFPALIIEIITSQGLLSSDGEISLWGMAFIMIGSQILPLIVFWKQKWCDYSFIKGVNYKKLLLLMALGWLGCVLVDACVQAYAPRFDWDTDILSSIEGMSTNPLGIISICILAPVVEEGVCRGAIERKLLEKDWNPWWAIVISAVLFALMHMNLTQGIIALILGLFLGWVYYRTRNIWLCIFVHALNNTVSTVLSLTLSDPDALSSFSLPVNLVLLLAGVGLVYLGANLTHKTMDGGGQLSV